MQKTTQGTNAIFGWVILSSILGMAGCGSESADVREQKDTNRVQQLSSIAQSTCPSPGDFDPQNLLYLLIDRSGSYFTDTDTVRQMKAEGKRYVHELPAGSAVYVAFISEASSRPQELVLKDAIPFAAEEAACKPSNPFDRAQRKHCATVNKQLEARRACVQEARRRIEQTIDDLLVPGKAPRTDVTGSLTMAGEILSLYPNARKGIVLLSDGVDTERKSLPAHVEGYEKATVVFRPPLGQAAEGQRNPMAKYVSAVTSWGAEASVVPLGIPVTAGLFPQVSVSPHVESSTVAVATR